MFTETEKFSQDYLASCGFLETLAPGTSPIARILKLVYHHEQLPSRLSEDQVKKDEN